LQTELEGLQHQVLDRLGSCTDAAAAEALSFGLRIVLENSGRRDRDFEAIRSASSAIAIRGKSREDELRRQNGEAYVAKQEEEYALRPRARRGRRPAADRVRKSRGVGGKGRAGSGKSKPVSPSSSDEDSVAVAAVATAAADAAASDESLK